MPLQNRVNPEGQICVSPSKQATLMGNRGCLHNDHKQVVRQSKNDQWITCVTEVRPGWKKSIPMTSGEYTELFFLDEATALAAGHRPCYTCRRPAYNLFFTAWSAANRSGESIRAADVDKQLKSDRDPSSRSEVQSTTGLPDGVMFKHVASGNYYLIRANSAYLWSFDGYSAPSPLSNLKGPFIILTPASTIGAIRHGYRPTLHSSAG
jgi:hypothetical protein